LTCPKGLCTNLVFLQMWKALRPTTFYFQPQVQGYLLIYFLHSLNSE
jgi:hypothetical protein